MRNQDDEDRVSWDVGRTVEELLLLALLLPLRIAYTTALYFAPPLEFTDRHNKNWRSLQVLCRPLTFATGNWIVYLLVIRLVWGQLERDISNSFNTLIDFLSPAIFSGNAMQVVLGIAPVLVLISIVACFQAAISRIFRAKLSFASHINLAAYGIGAFAVAAIVYNLIVGQGIQSLSDIGENKFLFFAAMVPFGIIVIRWTTLLSQLGSLTYWRSLITMVTTWIIATALVLSTAITVTDLSQSAAPAFSNNIEPFGKGPYSVGSTNMEVASGYADIGDEAMHEYLLGRTEKPDHSRYVADVLKYPESAWVIDVPVPDERALYGPVSGQTLPVVTYLTYPTSAKQQRNTYAFPYHDAKYGIFEDMLGATETPSFADPNERYPLIILAHGSSAHGIYDVAHAHSLASHGYIVAVIFYGDDRNDTDTLNHQVSFLRPLLTKAVLDSLLESEVFGVHIDTDNIGISGHSFGGFTALAVAGGSFLGNTATVSDKRIRAGVIAAPWVGGNYDGSDFFAFGPDNSDLNRVTAPMLCLFSTKDQMTLASFILPATKQLSGPTYVVELVGQPHIFEQGSWKDRDNWELLFFSAYLKNDPASLAQLKTARSMQGGNEDVQLFEYQRSTGND